LTPAGRCGLPLERPMTATIGDCADTILNALATAFGGHSQFSEKVVGAAILGTYNNAGPALHPAGPEAMMDACARAITDRWVDSGANYDSIRADIAAGYLSAAILMAR
jgi:hypothetical protein